MRNDDDGGGRADDLGRLAKRQTIHLWINYRYTGGYPEPVEVRKIAKSVASKLEAVLNDTSAGLTTKKELLRGLRSAARDIQRSGECFYVGSMRRLLVREE